MRRRLLILFVTITLLTGSAFASTSTRKKRHRVVRNTVNAVKVSVTTAPKLLGIHRSKKRLAQPFVDPTLGDSVDGEDLMARRAAVQALGPQSGAVIVADPGTGRILSVVNQKLAYQGAYEPCSTIKIVAALAGLNEGIINNQDSSLHITKHHSMALTEAIAHSNNAYFASVGEKLGYDKIVQYGQMFGLGEKAGLNIEAEQPGLIAEAPPTDGLGMMTSFGEGFSMTPMELTAIVSAVANGGTLYYLQHPGSQAEVDQFVPQVKRQLDVAQWMTDIKPGMMGAVEYGTARRAGFSATEPIFGKTGTCTDNRTPVHLGWFGSYNEIAGRKLVVVVLLTSAQHSVSGPIASGVAGAVYKNLSGENYFAQTAPQTSPAALISNHSY
ncbi:MAG TPA: penicillin-binding transpeptidase domain-containing protein [Bryobacteraceae bacterium]|nr:penicillin-binding transpeptidase domain-containing protein [Bryobacteraceae bacterium]